MVPRGRKYRYGASVPLDRVTWEDYEHVLEYLQEKPGVRITYDSGRLDIVTTSREHEEWKELILRLVQILCEEPRTDLQSYGGATWKLKREQKGAESDTSPALPKCNPSPSDRIR